MKNLNEFRNTNIFSLLDGTISDMAEIKEYFESEEIGGDLVGIGCEDANGDLTNSLRAQYIVRVSYEDKLVDHRVELRVPSLSSGRVRILETDKIMDWKK